MTDYRRFALYYAPPEGSALAAFGAAWLGWDPVAGVPVPHPDVPGLPRPVAELTATPRKYGFHGTLKPPFRLAEGVDAAGLRAAVARFAATQRGFDAPPLVARSLGPFVAMVPSGPSADLAAFAGACVEALEPFRAPLTQAEIVRRNPDKLTDRQRRMLDRWGYPYVFDEFRFHLTLTGRLHDGGEGAAVLQALAPVLDPLTDAPMPVRELCLFGEGQDGRFRVVERFALGG